MMGGTEADPGKDANKLTNKATLVQKKVLDHLLLLGVESQWAPVAIRCAALQCIGDLIVGQPKNLDILATKVLGEEPQTEPALNSILRILLRTSSMQEFIAADYVFKSFCEKNSDGQTMLASTLIPQPHLMTRAPLEEDVNMSFGSMLLHGLTLSENDGDLETCCRAAGVLSHVLKDNVQCKERLDDSLFVEIETGQSVVVDDPDVAFTVTAFDANHCPGKCANRLLASSGLPLIARQMKRLELSSIWALLAAFEDPLPIPGGAASSPFEGAFVKGVDSVSWMANNTKKLLHSQNSGPHCWTFLSTAAYGKRNKVPQENIPNATAEKVKAGMLGGVEAALGLPKESLQKPFYTRVQLWGAALPTNTPGIPCIFDPQGRAGICGDWLLGSSLESAALSGMALANHMADYFQGGGARPEEFAVGLMNEFQPLGGHDIGQFPGLESEKQTNEAQAYELAS